MTDTHRPNTAKRRSVLLIGLGLAIMVFFFVTTGVVTYSNIRMLQEDTERVTRTHDVLAALDQLLALTNDAETGERGFLITGDNSYLERYSNSIRVIDNRLDEIERLTVDNASQQSRIPGLRSRIQLRLEQLDEAIDAYRSGGFEDARKLVMTGRGKSAMEAIRSQIDGMKREEEVLRLTALEQMQNAYQLTRLSGLLSGIVGGLISFAVAFLMRRSALTRIHQNWLQNGQIEINLAMAGNQKRDELGENILKCVANYVGAQVGAIFVKNGGFERAATYGVPADGRVIETIEKGDGLLWRVIEERKSYLISDIPDGYLSLGSAFGSAKPRHLLIAPITNEDEVIAVIELGFLRPVRQPVTELLEEVSKSIGVAIRSVRYRSHLQHLLEETQRQSEELQAQGEELRVSNEELEEQSRALQESQARLENQQAEMEQVNSQLEEQTQLLEAQRDEAGRAKKSLEIQARRLAEASQYKSEFLANMSHELRTPLNSSLILAKLLADNESGNLTPEQVQYAETIQTAGNDLLMLITDILDLSKIEAGRMELRLGMVSLNGLQKDLERSFEVMAKEKGLEFRVLLTDGCPAAIETDRQRIEQVLKNLLSNAIKFTEQGSVELTISPVSDDEVEFAVTDTGIGISEDERELIFEAFQQVEGTASRKYGGTGLGLSISKRLVELLGGELRLESEPGQGSTFAVRLPRRHDESAKPQGPFEMQSAALSEERPTATFAKSQRVETRSAPKSPEKPIRNPCKDDRDNLNRDRRTILVVEDDPSFARIMIDLVRESDFHCLVAATAEEGLNLAFEYLPHAVILDIGLPDNSGLTVLDRLKQDRRSRHIPVHVVSANDYSQTALEMGAVGYLFKPVKREELADALKQLEARLTEKMRRILIVEDDPVQLSSLQKLLETHNTETVGVATASECLEQLKQQTFDCMVLDLTLPDASGFTLLETLSSEEAYSFPPAIVYTGRDLSPDEEQSLRRYSSSIIIKGAKSPERLLDEVTLFLHQVVSELPQDKQKMLEEAKHRDAALEGRRILIVEDDVRNVFALTSILEPKGAVIQIARNGLEAIDALEKSLNADGAQIDLVLMDVMMPEMDGITAIGEIRQRSEWKKLPVIMLTAKAMEGDQENCLNAGANDYMSKPIDVDKLLSLVRVWMPR